MKVRAKSHFFADERSHFEAALPPRSDYLLRTTIVSGLAVRGSSMSQGGAYRVCPFCVATCGVVAEVEGTSILNVHGRAFRRLPGPKPSAPLRSAE
jgi:hypothetical protein